MSNKLEVLQYWVVHRRMGDRNDKMIWQQTNQKIIHFFPEEDSNLGHLQNSQRVMRRISKCYSYCLMDIGNEWKGQEASKQMNMTWHQNKSKLDTVDEKTICFYDYWHLQLHWRFSNLNFNIPWGVVGVLTLLYYSCFASPPLAMFVLGNVGSCQFLFCCMLSLIPFSLSLLPHVSREAWRFWRIRFQHGALVARKLPHCDRGVAFPLRCIWLPHELSHLWLHDGHRRVDFWNIHSEMSKHRLPRPRSFFSAEIPVMLEISRSAFSSNVLVYVVSQWHHGWFFQRFFSNSYLSTLR